jgi:hypothetical protein
MTLRPEIEALVQGALDGSLSPDDRKALNQLLATDPAVRARAAELEQLSQLLQSLGQVDLPAAFTSDVLARIQTLGEPSGRVADFSRASQAGRHPANRGSMAINKKVIWGLAAAAVLVLAVVGYVANPSVNQGTEATIGTAQRYQAPQIEAKDVAVGDTKTIALMQTATWDAIVKDETLRTLLQDANFRVKLQDEGLRQALADADLLRALRSPNVARALADPEMAKKFSDPELQKKLADADLRTALASPALVRAMADADFRSKLFDAGVTAALARPAFQDALRDGGFAAALRHPAFAEALVAGCYGWVCGSNSPVVDGAVIK